MLAPELTELAMMYGRQTPDVDRARDDARSILATAARGHVELATKRTRGQTLIRVRERGPRGAAGRTVHTGPVVEIVTDDMPFLVSAVVGAVAELDVDVEYVIHPIVVVRRGLDGLLDETLIGADPVAPPANALVESWIHLSLSALPMPAVELERRLAGVLREVRRLVEDTDSIRHRALALAERLLAAPQDENQDGVAEAARLLRWLVDGNFTFFGFRAYELGTDGTLRTTPETGLGTLRDDAAVGAAPPVVQPDVVDGRVDVVFTRAGGSGPLRQIPPNLVAVRSADRMGRTVAEYQFVGSLTVPARYGNVLDIPVVERNVREAIHLAGFPIESYSGQQMLEVISGIPREELFGASARQVHDIAVGVLAVPDRRVVRLFVRPDPYDRFLSCLVYLPRDRYTTSSRLAMADVLARRLGGLSVAHTARVSESRLALVHFTVHIDPDRMGGRPGEMDVAALQRELTDAVRNWTDRLLAAPDGAELAARVPVIPEAYKAVVEPAEAVDDLRRIAALSRSGEFDVRLRPGGAQGEHRRLTLYLAGSPATLTAVLPLLQQLGVDVLDERASEFARSDGLAVYVYDFSLRFDEPTRAAVAALDHQTAESEFCLAFAAAWRGDAETDRFSALVLRAGLSWREVAVLRAYASYSRQLGGPYGPPFLAEVLLAHTAVARSLITLFRTKFDPTLGERREAAMAAAHTEARTLIDTVAGLDVDRILRGYLAMIAATVRTNWFRDRNYFSIKIDPSRVPGMPAPVPSTEIFVYSPRMEGVHLRFGAVARGGLRWSDRLQDYRTEVLGLVKAQAVKNAVIVPAGAKGGFVVRASRPDAAEVEACYRMFVSALLDLTDNLVAAGAGTETVRPPRVVCHDGPDPYLVVAADKGTARFSDTANDVAKSYGFWLGDAFASGGSVGYDHKAMGITAKGAWESAKRHFRELGVDLQHQDFTVVGIGDMSGDVFGNGMLRSPHIRLIAAFDHRHVFIDPNPVAARSCQERLRLFALPGSSWADYDRAALSAGGGVWSRSAKSVAISPQIRTALALTEDVQVLSPPDLIAAILRAPVDLLWNGGIGTYVKASDESHAEVGDKANDSVRVDACDLRAKVVVEGGNLGLTQRARIEFARRGGKINTDAIDNSAGVDCSDREVNIKIALDQLVANGELTRHARDALLRELTDEVTELVLADNRAQNEVLAIARKHGPDMVNVHARLTADLVARRGLDRALDVLPDAEGYTALAAAGQGLTGPELATLLAHVKLDLTDRILATDLPDTTEFAARLSEYFPRILGERFPAALSGHPLRREIVTTVLVNDMVDHAGTTYAFRLGEELATEVADALLAYAATAAVFDLPAVMAGLPASVSTDVTDGIVLESRRLLDRAARWFLANRPQPLAVAAEIDRLATAIRGLRTQLPALLRGAERAVVCADARRLRAAGVDAEPALRTATLTCSYGLLDVVELVELAGSESWEHTEVAALYYALSDHLGVDLTLNSVAALPRGDRWHALARQALRDDLYGSLRAITLDALRETAPGTPVETAIAQWEKANETRLARARSEFEEVRSAGRLDLATLSVVSRHLRSLAR